MGTLYGINSSGVITSQGINLPSSGGTATTLDYNGKETIVFQMTGSVTPTFDFPVTFSRVGKNVVMEWESFVKLRNVSGQSLFTGQDVPSRFLPTYSNPPVWVKSIIDGSSVSSFSAGIISFGSSGEIIISRLDTFPFSNIYCGILGSSICYTVN